VHRLVLEAFVGACPTGQQARHLDGNADNPRLDNLAWGTARENMEDRFRHGRTALARLTDDEVRGARRRLRDVMQELADELDVSFNTIVRLSRFETYKHIRTPRS
jgi:hypothetical protein